MQDDSAPCSSEQKMKSLPVVPKSKKCSIVISFRFISSICQQTEFSPVDNISDPTVKVQSLCENNQIDSAIALLDSLRTHGYTPNCSTLSTIVRSLCNSDRFLEAHSRLFLLLSANWVPPPQTANSMIAHLLNSRKTPHLTLNFVNQLVSKNPFFILSLSNCNKIIDQFCVLDRLCEAREVLDCMLRRRQKPSVVSYTSLVTGYVKNCDLDNAYKVFDEMSKLGVMPNSLTLSILIRGVLRKRRVDEGRGLMSKLWEKMEEEKGGDMEVRSAAFANLVDSLCREGFFGDVFRIAEEMPQGKLVKEKFAYGQMIDSLCRVGRYHGASRIVYIMRKQGIIPSLVSYNNIIHGLSKHKGCMRAYQLFKEGTEFGFMLPEITYKVLVEALCHEKDIVKAKDVTDFMFRDNGVDKTKIYNILLSALRLVDNPNEQLNMLMLMLQNQCKPNTITLNTIIHGFCKIGKVDEASKILNDMLNGKFSAPDVVTFTTMINGFLTVGKIEEALVLLDHAMPQYSCAPNIVTYNAVLFGLCKYKLVHEAMNIFSKMLSKGVLANSVTYTAMIDGFFVVGRIEDAKRFWEDIVWPSKVHNDFVYAAIIRGLCKLGKLGEACDFLYELVDSGIDLGIVNYNIIIDAAQKLGSKKEAYQMVKEMRNNGLRPDAVTWRILNKFHFGNRNAETKCKLNIEDKLDNEILENADNENCNDDIDKFGGPSTKALDSGLTTEVSKTYTSESLSMSHKEPLSSIARRVFGLR